MLYLASQFVWFLVAAFALGLVMGWIGHDGSKLRVFGRGAGWFAALWALGAGLTWLQIVNGAPATWIESALLFSGVYVAGCVVAELLRGSRRADDAAVAAEPTAKRTPAAVPATVPAAAPPPVDGEAAIPGERPAGLVAARAEKPDDLKLIKGVAEQNEARLHALGIWHFEQIAAWTPRNVEWVGNYLAFPGRIEREDWVGQSKRLAAETDAAAAAPAETVSGVDKPTA